MSKLGKEGHNGHFRICLNENNAKKSYSVISSKREKGAVAIGKNAGEQQFVIFEFFLERERLLSSFPANPTVGSLRDKKKSCSTQSRLHVDTGFEEF